MRKELRREDIKIQGFQGINFTNRDFTNDLPYIQQAFQEAVEDLRTHLQPLAGNLTPDIIEIVMQLCEPDPCLRGNPKSIGKRFLQHDLQRYISRLDVLSSKAELRIL